MPKTLLSPHNNTVTVVIPASRIPTPAMLDFWNELGALELVEKVVFAVNGADRAKIVDLLENNLDGKKKFEITSTEIGSAPLARNIGLAKVDSSYVHFLDDDDQIRQAFYPNAIKTIAEKDFVGVAVSADVYVDGEPDNTYRVSRPDRVVGLQSLLIENYLGPTSGVLLKTNAVKSVGGFDEGMPARQDYDLWLRLAQIGDFRLLPEPLLIWTENRSRPSIRNSTSTERHRVAAEKLMERKLALGWNDLPLLQRRRGAANHYKYLAVMSKLNDGTLTFSYVVRSIAAYPQAKTVMMLMPESVSRYARKVVSGVRHKKKGSEQYGNAERRLASALAKFPHVKRALKYMYQGTFYVLNWRKRNAFKTYSGQLSAVRVPGREEAETFFGYYDRNPENSKGYLAVHTLEANECRVNIVGSDGALIASTPTNAWNYQQGALPCWVDAETIIFNDSRDGQLRTVIHHIPSETKKYFDGSFQAWSSENRRLASININLINKLRPEYGLNGTDPLFESEDQLLAFRSIDDPDSTVTYVTVTDMAKVTGLALPVGKTKINHVVFSPDGRRVTFLLRYFEGQVKRTFQVIHEFESGANHVVKCGDVVSHYCWLGNELLAIWGTFSNESRGYFLSNCTGDVSTVRMIPGGLSAGDGHPTPVPGTQFLVSDTYPDKSGMSHLYSFSWKTGSEQELGAFHQPFRFRGAKRIDMHPRYSPISGNIYIDSGHSGKRGAYRLRAAVDRMTEDLE